MTDTIALQLYTVRDETEKDFKQTLRHVAEIGYPGVEFAGYGGLSPQEISDLLKETGLKAVGAHVGFYELQHDFEHQVEYCLAAGIPYWFVPWIDVKTILEPDQLKSFTEILNEAGQRLQKHGIGFGYHNHDFEFANKVNDISIYEHLIANTDPNLVKFELDTFWVAFAGLNPVELIEKLGSRLATLHIKDMNAERTFTEVGDGTLPIADYIKAGRAAGASAFIVENDHPAIPSLDSARRSFANLQGGLA